MKIGHLALPSFAAATLLAVALGAGCASTSIKTAWKAPDYKGGPAKKVVVVAVADRGLVREGFENRFATEMTKGGQATLTTYDLIGLPEIKANKDAAVAKFSQAGADVILITRLRNTTTRYTEVRETPEMHVPVITGINTDGWYNWYSVAFTDMSAVRGSVRQHAFLETGLFDLATGKRLWACATDTVIEDESDRLVLADAFVAKIVAALRKDGLIR